MAIIGPPLPTGKTYCRYLRDAPWLPIVRDNIKQAAEAGGILLNSAVGPDENSIAATAEMSATDRNAMILSMVSGFVTV